MLGHLIRVDGSDLHVAANSPPRHTGQQRLAPAPFPVANADQLQDTLKEVLTPDRLEEFHRTGEADFSLSISGLGRFRGNACRQRGTGALVLRRVLPVAATAETLGLPPVVTRLAAEQRGMVLVTGPTGSGKTTTLAALIDHINTTRACKIVTIEDPIEVIHDDKRSVIWQREIGN